jgi:hypothetical protein
LFRNYSPNIWLTHGFGALLVMAFMYFVSRVESKEFAKIKAGIK